MGLTSIPEKIAASIGAELRDRPRPLARDARYAASAAEFERLKDAVIALSQAVGLEDGSTEGSLEARTAHLSDQGVSVHDVETEDDTATLLYLDDADPAADAQYEILVSARKVTSPFPDETYAMFSYRAVRVSSSEGAIVDAVAMHADTGTGVSGESWGITIEENANRLRVMVTGAVSSTVTWRAIVRRWVTG